MAFLIGTELLAAGSLLLATVVRLRALRVLFAVLFAALTAAASVRLLVLVMGSSV